MNTYKSWRLIPRLELPGALQMAIDDWLLDQHAQHLHPPTLRFYTWEPAAISLGYHQRHWPKHWGTLANDRATILAAAEPSGSNLLTADRTLPTWQSKPLDLVRRPTGGRAVLHQGDLTYAVITSNLPQHRTLAYRYLCQFLIDGWRSMGISLRYGNVGRGYIHNPNCFGTTTQADLIIDDEDATGISPPSGFPIETGDRPETTDDKPNTTRTQIKLIGSAQLWRGQAVLQHGSMQLSTDPMLFETVFGSPARTFQCQSSVLEQLKKIPYESIVETLSEVAAKSFDIELSEQPLSAQEWAEVRERTIQFQKPSSS